MIFALSTLSSNLVELGWFSVVALFLLCFLPLVWCERRGLATFFGSVSFLVCLLVFAWYELSWLQLLSRAAAMSATAQCMYQHAIWPRDDRDRSPWPLFGMFCNALFVLQLIVSK